MKILAPSILAADFSNLSQQIRYAEMGGADWIHCDIMDGIFVPNISFGPEVVRSVNHITNLPVDVHLMIKDPDKFIKDFAEAGADYITVHQEEIVHLHRVVELIKSYGAKAGVTINPATPLSALEGILEFVDMVLLMSVNPGFGGQKYIESSTKKISDLYEIRKMRGLDFLIEVDGGIETTNIEEISDAGCDVFVAGSSIFKKDNISAAAVELKNIINKNTDKLV